MKILIVDDEKVQGELLQGFLQKQDYEVSWLPDGESALQFFARNHVDLVLLDHKMPGMTGDQVLARLKAENPELRAIMITAYGDVETAVKVMKLGADDFLSKPIDLETLLAKIRRIEQELFVAEDVREVEEAAAADKPLPVKIVANSAAMKEVISLVRRVAATPWSVLIKGETGTGKELLASLIHHLSPRREAPLIEVNCAAVPENLFESELFGHEKGAFTGATGRRRGRFELAHQGTVFLDEIGELPLALQPKLLRTLQENRITPVGGEKDIEVDVRVIAATNRNLKEMVQAGTFREDLYYRLNVFELEIPPLRERREDIPTLLELFISRYAGGRRLELSPEARNIMIKYPYPGNVRELEHIVQRLVTLARGSLIKPADLPPEVRHYQVTTVGTLEEKLKAAEREMILTALEKADWVQTRAAAALGISERVLRYKMDGHGIKRSRAR
ncbi:MAG: sigma-54-dependent Fis family transcriptional regulator [Deltaproteobacteria bacterium]|nr:sigma-54-dependent Fis family transcriptional regulator [Deltaproteobacteria bacterium]